MRGLLGLLCLSALAFAAGCGVLPKKAQRPPLSAPQVSLKQVKEVMEKRVEAFHDLTASARLTLRTSEGHTALRQILLLQKGPYIRAETLGPFGQPSAYFTSNAEKINVYYPDQGKFFAGSPSSKNVLNFLGINIDVADLVMLLTGNLPQRGGNGRETLDYMPEDGAYLLSQTNLDGPFRERLVWVEPKSFYPVTVKFYGSGSFPVLRVDYDKYQEVNGFGLPTRIVISHPSDGVEITLNYISPEVNKGVSSAAFFLPVPEGVQVIELGR